MPDASSAPAAASLCCAPYESRLLAPGRAELNAALGMYGAPYAAGQGYGNYLPYSAEPAALYTALVSARPPGQRTGGRGGWGGGAGGGCDVCNRRQTSWFAVGVGAGDRRRTRNRRGPVVGGRGAVAAAGTRGGGVPPPARGQTLPLPLQNPQYEIKDGAGTLHSGIAQPAAYYSYDHSLGQYQYDR